MPTRDSRLPPTQGVPTVFISSTSEDLREYREAARDAALQAGFFPSMMEYFTASGARPPLLACLEKVDAADLVIAIVAHRYGWTPDDPSNADGRSITWLECERAAAQGKELLAFVADPGADWPHERREEFRLMQAVAEQKLTPSLGDEVQRAVRRLGELKAWLDGRGLRARFRTPDDLGRHVAAALHDWRQRHPTFERAEPPRGDDKAALEIYRRELLKTSRYVPLQGLDVPASDPTSDASRLELARVYVGLNTTSQVEAEGKRGKRRKRGIEELDLSGTDPGETRPLRALEAIAANRRLVVLGGPGSGKSTLLNHLTFCLVSHQIDPDLDWLSRLEGWPVDEATVVPIVVTLRDFARTLEGRSAAHASRADLLWDFIDARLEAQNLRSAAAPLEDALEAGRALVLLDGLDEIPTRPQRVAVRAAVQAFCDRYDRSRHIVTCRTLSYQDADVRLERFPSVELAAFDDEQVKAFIGAWYSELVRLNQIDEHAAAGLRERLATAARRGDLVSLARNPMLLTEMALVNTHRGRLPDARALLYEEVVDILLWRWESRKGEERQGLRAVLTEAGRSESDLKRVLWQLAFETHLKGGAEGREGAADIDEGSLVRALIVLHPSQDRNWAWQLVGLMRVRAGLLLERAPGIFTFPHRTFQEYLAGAHLSVQEKLTEQCLRLTTDVALWRQVILLAVGRPVHVAGNVERPIALVAELCPSALDPATADDAECRRAWLAGEVLQEVGVDRAVISALGRDVAARIPRVVAHLLERGVLTPVERGALGVTLARIGDPRFDRARWFLPADSDPGAPLGFLRVDAGPFRMGSDPRRDTRAGEAEQPQRPVDLPEFYIARYPVTVAQFRAFVEANPDVTPGDPRLRGEPNHPVVNVSWHEALKYCEWLTEALRAWKDAPREVSSWLEATLKYDKRWQVTLPSEAEWEKAARGSDGRIYPWGDVFEANRANTWESEISQTTAVGAFPGGRSPCGALDLSGNVWEWTRSLWGKDVEKPRFKYPYNPDDGREDLRAGLLSRRRSLRSLAAARAADRQPDEPVLGERVHEPVRSFRHARAWLPCVHPLRGRFPAVC